MVHDMRWAVEVLTMLIPVIIAGLGLLFMLCGYSRDIDWIFLIGAMLFTATAVGVILNC